VIDRLVPLVYAIVNTVVGVPCRYLFFRVEADGVENVPKSGGAILVANHLSNYDVGLITTTAGRRVRFMAKQELFKPVIGLALRLLGTFPVRRLEADRRAVREAEKFAAEGELLGMFPEGTRSRTGEMQKAWDGTAFIALRSRVPIVPAGITGTERIGSTLTAPFRRPKVHITYGRPFYLERPQRLTAEGVQKSTAAMMRRVAELVPEGYRGYYGDTAEADKEGAALVSEDLSPVTRE
jgi:1-acyl-sn-glycerol-3-phosphate acyltransferase